MAEPVGIVLAGGRSSRFGSDKLAAMLAGRSLVVHVIERLRLVPGLAGVVVVGPAPPAEPGWLPAVRSIEGARVVRDARPYEGPLAGLAAGLRALPPGAVAIVAGGDMPELDPAVLASLARAVAPARGVELAALVADGREQPLPLAVAVSAGLDAAERLLAGGERRLRAFAAAFGERRRLLPAAAGAVRDVDRPEDLDARA